MSQARGSATPSGRKQEDTMQEILIACGDVALLKKIIAELPGDQLKPIATKRGQGTAQKVSGRGLASAIVYEQLADGATGQLLQDLRQLTPRPKVLLLTGDAPPKQGPFEVALRYPVPGPVFRNAVQKILPEQETEHDLERWRTFYRELKARRQKLPEQSYYDMLGIRQDSPHHALVKAFDAASLRYHPDRYDKYRGERWGEAIYQETNTLYKAMTEAYFMLSDRTLRKAYDKALEEGRLRMTSEEANAMKNAGPVSLEALGETSASKKFLRLAQSDVAAQNWSSALQNLKFAASMEPNNAEIQAKIDEVSAKLG